MFQTRITHNIYPLNFNRGQVIVAIAISILTTATHAETLTGRVVGIADGDTLTLLDATKTQHKIRLSGIDSPEMSQPFAYSTETGHPVHAKWTVGA